MGSDLEIIRTDRDEVEMEMGSDGMSGSFALDRYDRAVRGGPDGSSGEGVPSEAEDWPAILGVPAVRAGFCWGSPSVLASGFWGNRFDDLP
jgi:hypothetical protein